MSLCEKIKSAKCCVVDIAGAYVRASTMGENTTALLSELLLVNAYIEALERYGCECSKNNCLSEQEVCFILEQISLLCESCECGC
jgi:hypothetical protein